MEPLDQKINIRLTKTEKERIETLAKKDGRSMSNLCRMVIIKYLEENIKE
ncbi:plasmid mobilization protein [Ezakiella coagulans]|nr:ribbon-helix-helix protein, CopG family [Ezakiella coagulans]